MTEIVIHSGKIVDQDGMNLIGAHIVADIKDKKGTISDFEGNFKIHGQEGEKWTIGHIGKKSRTITLKKEMQQSVTYTLMDQGIQLDEVVVTSGPKKKPAKWAVLFGMIGLFAIYKRIKK